jgi:hypothetical protein
MQIAARHARMAVSNRQVTMEPPKPVPKKLLQARLFTGRPTIQPTEFKVGDSVYARYHGDRVLQIVGVANVNTPAPHYICEVDGDRYIISKMQLSTKPLISEVHGGNRRQLQLPV